MLPEVQQLKEASPTQAPQQPDDPDAPAGPGDRDDPGGAVRGPVGRPASAARTGRALDAAAVRFWCACALDALGRTREEIDAINVYPVADGDTGTNLYLTLESAARAVDASFTGLAPQHPTLAQAVRALAHGALIGARGNSGTILAQLLRGMADVLSAPAAGRERGAAVPAAPGIPEVPEARDAREVRGAAREGERPGGGGAAEADRLRRALVRAAESAYAAVAHPVEGTVLTVATAAAAAASGAEGDCGAVARAAYEAARTALAATPGQLAALGSAGVVDAGGQGLVVLLAALAETFTGEGLTAGARLRQSRPPAARRTPSEPAPVPVGDAPAHSRRSSAPYASEETGSGGGAPHHDGAAPATGARASGRAAVDGASGAPEGCAVAAGTGGGPAYEVIYLLEAGESAVGRLRARLDALGDSLVVSGGDGLWHIHVHVDDAGAAVEAGVEAGRPYRVRITHFASDDVHAAPAAATPQRERAQRAVVAVVPCEGLGTLCTEAGATTVLAHPGEPPASGELAAAIRRAHAHEVVVLPNDDALRHAAGAAAEQVRTSGIRVAVIPTRAAVQGLAALAVHEPGRRFDEDVVAMTSAAGGTRYAELTVAEHRSWTTAGICQAGDVLGLIDGDVAVIGPDPAATATAVLDRMLSAGGELVTLIASDTAPDTLTGHLEAHVRQAHLAVDTVAYPGGRQTQLLLIGVE